MRPLRGIRDVERRPRRPRGPARGGFTLIELLVSMAIFVTVMASVTLLFNSAIRTTKQGFLNQDAFEIARGAMDILERDLSRSFTSRDHGDVYNFYGTPIGFTFVGMITAGDSPNPNLARITYVMYHVPTSVQNIAGAVSIYESVDGARIGTFNLLRYIEIGKEDLESFPVDWARAALPEERTFNQLIQDEINLSGCPDSECIDEIRKAKKRELWIRMLSGGDFEVSSAWAPGGILFGLDPFDYVIAENIRFLGSDGSRCVGTGPDDFASLDELQAGTDFDDEILPGFDCTVPESPGTRTCTLFLADVDHSPRITPGDNFFAIPRAQDPIPFFTYRDYGTRIRKNGCGFTVFKPNPFDPFNPDSFLLNEFDDPIPETDVAPIDLQFWNDSRNFAYMQFRENLILTDGQNNDGDFFIDEFGDLQPLIDEPDEANGINLGSPLDARAPIEITVNFTLFFPSPYPGAPDFNRKFTMRIDLPTGYRRTFDRPVTP